MQQGTGCHKVKVCDLNIPSEKHKPFSLNTEKETQTKTAIHLQYVSEA
jgi:hypothetical protein